MESSAVVASRLIGAIFVESGLISSEQLEHALLVQEQTGERLGEIVISEFGVSRIDLATVLAEQWAELRERDPARLPTEGGAAIREPGTPGERRPLGEIFVERGLITIDQLDAALVRQQEAGGRIGEILLQDGTIEPVDLADALAEQWSLLRVLRGPATAAMPTPGRVRPANDSAGMERALQDLAQRIGALEDGWEMVRLTDLERVEATLREEVSAVERRVVSALGRREHEHDAREAIDALQARLEALETGSAAVASTLRAELSAVEAELGGSVSVLRSSIEERLAQAPERLEDLSARLAACADSVASLEAQSAAGASSAAEARHDLDGLLHRVGDLEARAADAATAAAVTSLRAEVDDVRAGLPGLVSDLAADLVPAAERAADTAVGGLREELGQLDERLRRDRDGLVDRVAALEAMLAESAAGAVGAADLAELRSRVDAGLLEVQGRAEEAADGAVGRLREELGLLDVRVRRDRDGLVERVAALESAPRETPGAAAAADLADLRSRLDAGLLELQGRAEQAAERSAVELGVARAETEHLRGEVQAVREIADERERRQLARTQAIEDGLEELATIMREELRDLRAILSPAPGARGDQLVEEAPERQATTPGPSEGPRGSRSRKKKAKVGKKAKKAAKHGRDSG